MQPARRAPHSLSLGSSDSVAVRTFFLLTLVLLTACAGPVAETPRTAPGTPANKSPIVAALTHFRSLPDLWLPTASVSKGVLLLNSQTTAGKGFISADQLRSDLSSVSWSIPEDARADMERRADAHEPLQTTGFPSFLRVIDFEVHPSGGVSEFYQRHPDARCSIDLWPTGYTRDGTRAVVRFLFGPTPHNASAVYLLELRNGLWHVSRYNVAYYA